MRNKFFVGWLLIFFISLSFINAEIMISQPNTLYNLGDELKVDFEVNDFQESYFDANLICDQGSTNLFHGVLSAKVLEITRKLIPEYIGNLSGNCYFQATYGSDSSTSQSFEISNELVINLKLRELTYKAGENIIISGEVIKKSNSELMGNPSPSVEVLLGNELKTNGIVENDNFEVNLSTPIDFNSGEYTLDIWVYEKDAKGEVLNKGKANAVLTITQEPDHLDLAIESQIINPGETIKVVPILYDRSGTQIDGEEVVMRILDVYDNMVYEKLVTSGQEIEVEISTNHAPGYSRIVLERGEMVSEKLVDIQENEMIKVVMANGTMNVVNIGNVEYKKPLEINIGGKIILKNIDLKLGESKDYLLSAPTGDYEVVVSSGKGVLHNGKVSLTGNAISVDEIKEGAIKIAKSPIVWIFILIIIVLTIFVMYKNHSKKKQYSFPIDVVKKPAKTKEEIKRVIEKTKEKIDNKDLLKTDKNLITPGKIKFGEKVLVLNGEKQNAGIISLNIKNNVQNEFGKQTLNNSFQEAYKEKGVIARTDSGFLIVFSPMITKTSRNTEKAIVVASKIEKIIKDHNKKYKDKIEFGLGVVSGEIINQIVEGVLKFTEIGNKITLCKKIAGFSKEETLVSQEAHDLTRTTIKVERAEELSKSIGASVYKVKQIRVQERKSEFIQGFINRNK